MIIHELGHVCAARACGVPASELGMGLGPRLFGFAIGNLRFTLRAIPVASFARLDGTALSECSLAAQLFVHLGGIIFNLAIALIAHATLLGRINLLPLYKHDGWKCGLVLMRALARKQSQPVEWVFTFSGGIVSLIIAIKLIHMFGLGV
jgi:hypothetical protein